MTTARKFHSLATGARTFVLAGSLALASILPSVGIVYADGGVSTPSADQPALTQEEAFDVDPAGGLTNIEAVVVAPATEAPLLAEPAADAEVVDTLPEGTNVLLRIDTTDSVYSDDGQTRYWPVDVGGTTGWVNGQSLMSPEDYAARSGTSADGSTTAPAATDRQPFDYTGELENATAQVDADGEGLTLRAEPASSSEAVTSIQEGAIVDLRIADVDTVYDTEGTRWWPVSYEGYDGWVSGYYLITPGSTPQASASDSSTSVPQAPAETTPDGDFVYIPGDWAVVRTEDSGRTDLFASPDASSESTATIPNMALVEVLAQADGGWYEVRWDSNQGYISGELLTAGTAPRRAQGDVDPAPTPTPAAVSTETAAEVATDPLVANDVAKIQSDSGAGVNVRAEGSADAESVGFLNDGAQVTVLEGPAADGDSNWYRVQAEGDVEGWVRADLMVRVAASTEDTTEASTDQSDAGFILPVANYRFTQDYGCSNLGFYGYDPNWGCSVHDGVDLAATAGTPLMAAADGTVVVSGWCDCGLGYYVEIDHGDGIHSVYGHMIGQPPVTVGQEVKQGDEIGQVGSTGLSTGPHVHFMVRENGVTVDPKNYLPPVRENAQNAS